MRVEILPELGAKIYSIYYKPLETELLWQNPAISPRRVRPGDSYDDNWSGGWDEIFPNDEPAYPDTFAFPDHGELWSQAWTSSVGFDRGQARVQLRTVCERAQCEVEKWVSLAGVDAELRVRYRVTNLGARKVPFMLKLHPALAVSPGDRIIIPASSFRLEPRFMGTLDGAPVEMNTPVLNLKGREIDLLSVAPRETRDLFFFYGVDLAGGEWRLVRPENQFTATLNFSREIFNSCWLFASYGGWNDYYVAVPEPCTGYPFRLEEAIHSGSAPKLGPGGSLETEVVLNLGRTLA